ncbi:helix-turn-helix domain-containing protein [Paraburkholderia silvatlantica]|uniref:helix-turn-helix domain-containing protein n=1 Tax=Paraburkholderia silvatlantica TaxID=321895 RepID=UPI0037519F46
MFQSANALSRSEAATGGKIRYDVTLLSIAGGRIDSSSSVFVWTESVENRRFADGFHALFVAGGAGARHTLRDERLIRWLQREGSRSEAVVPIGDGRLLLDAAGVQRSTDGWDTFLRGVAEPHRSAEGGFAAAVTAPVRKALALIEQDCGGEFAREAVGRVMTQQQTSFAAAIRENVSGFVSERIQTSAKWLEANGDRPITIDDAAQIAAMSERNFLRRFKIEMGVTPSDYLLYVRIDMCCRLLVDTDLPVDKVARRCGLGSGGWLAKLFRKHLSTTPTEYRTNMRRAVS